MNIKLQAKHLIYNYIDMNRLITYIGGLPLKLNDLNFIQDAVKSVLEGVVKGFAPSVNFKISGCEVLKSNETTYVCSSGWIFLNGEILFVKEHTKVSSGDKDTPCFFKLSTSYNPAGRKVFKKGGTKDCYQIREAVLETSVTAPVGALLWNGNVLKDWLRIEDPWHEVGAVGEPVFHSSWTSNVFQKLKFRKTRDNIVFITGYTCYNGSDVLLPLVFTLPEAYRPRQMVNRLCSGAGDNIVRLHIETNGAVNVYPAVDFDADISYSLD